MKISISSRIRYAMVALSVGLCALFAMLIFLLVYVIEDQVFVNQLKVERSHYEQSRFADWQPNNGAVKLILSSDKLPSELPVRLRSTIVKMQGVHEYFDNDAAVFIGHFIHPDSGEHYFLLYDVKELLAVRGSKTELLSLIALLTLLISGASVLLAHRLTKKTLAPVRELTYQLMNSDIDEPAINLANEFSKDEIGVLANELASALKRAGDIAQREYDFNRGVSHELRSPIQVAQSATELLEKLTQPGTILDNHAIQKPIARLRRSVEEMNQIAEAFLWLIGNRKVGPLDVCSVTAINGLLKNYHSRTPTVEWQTQRDVGDEFEYPLPESVLLVILRSLIDNALKHGGDRQIAISLEPRQISLENLLKNESVNGFGLGLAITRRLCAHFNCVLLVEDTLPDVFKVCLEVPALLRPQHNSTTD